MAVMSFLTVSLLFALGLFTVLSQRNVFKTVIGLTLMESAVLLLLISWAYIPGGSAPILPLQGKGVDPLPHSFTLTAIVIGFGVLAFLLALVERTHQVVPTDDVDELKGTDT